MGQDNNSKKFGRRYLIYAILIASAAVLSFLYVDLLDVEETLVKEEFEYHEKRVLDDMDDFFRPINQEFNFMVELMVLEGFDLSDSMAFIPRFIPLLKSSKSISSVMLADEEGNEQMLLKIDEHYVYRQTSEIGGKLMNRRYRIDRWLDQRFNKLKFESTEEYDPRDRPWYKQAESVEVGQMTWTKVPYSFFTTNDLGVTISGRFKSLEGEIFYIAFDVLLNDLSKVTESLGIGENGIVFIAGPQGKMAALPKSDSLKAYDRKDLLQLPMDEFPLSKVKAAYNAIDLENLPHPTERIKYLNENWWVKAALYEVNDISGIIVMMAREKDFKGELSHTRKVLLGSILLIFFFFFIIMRFYAQQRKTNLQLKEQNHTIETQKELIEESLTEISDSIDYAEKVQYALLSDHEQLPKLFPESFILFLPKDVLSGDFYWFTEYNGKRFIAAADCTGHGVPGALLSVMGTNFLDDIVINKGIDQASEILGALRSMVVNAFNVENGGKRHDGMDIALLVFDESNNEIQYSGAKNPLYLIREGELQVYNADRMAVGFEDGEIMEQAFKQESIELQKGDCLYMFSDGYADQFGGEKGKKFMYGKLKKYLLEIHQKEMNDQKDLLYKTFQDWKGEEAQVDDVIIIGIRV